MFDGFVNPVLAFGAALAAVPLIIHLLNRQRHRPLQWAAMRFVLEAYRRTRRRARIENLILLLLRMAAIALLALAAARPYVGADGPLSALTESRRDVVIVLDGSASTRYRENVESVFEAIVARARELTLELDGGRGDTVRLVLAGRYPRLLSWRSPEEALSLLGTLTEPTDEPFDLAGALGEVVRFAEEDAAGAGRSSLEVRLLTDMQRRSFARSLAPDPEEAASEGERLALAEELDRLRELDVRVYVEDLGPAAPIPPNLGVTGFEIQTELLAPGVPVEVGVVVANHGPRPRSNVRVVLAVDGEKRPHKRIEHLPARGAERVIFAVQFTRPGPHVLTASIDPDRLTVDDARTRVVTVPPPLRCLLVDGAPSPDIDLDEVGFLASVLEPPDGDSLGDETRPFVPRVIDRSDLLDPDLDLDDHDVIVLANVARIATRTALDLEEWVASGGALLVTVGDQVDVPAWNQRLFAVDGSGLLPAELERRVAVASRRESYYRVHEFEAAHPALSFFADERWQPLLTEVPVYEFLGTRPLDDARVLARLDDGARSPLLIERRYDRGLVFLWTTTIDKAWTRLPESPRTLVPLVHELLRYAGRPREAARNVGVGEPLQAEVASFPRELALVRPDGSRRPLDAEPEPAGTNRWRLPPVTETDDAGLYTIASTGAESVSFAVRIEAAEGDLERLGEVELGELHPAFKLVSRDSQRTGDDPEDPARGELWRWLAGACLAALVLESLWAAWIGRNRAGSGRPGRCELGRGRHRMSIPLLSTFADAAPLGQVPDALREGEGLRETLRLMDLPELWIVVLLLLPLTAFVCWLGYFREAISRPWRAALATLRWCALLLLLVVLFRPVLVQRLEEVQPAEVIVLVDDSASMLRVDSYRGDGENRAALGRLAEGPVDETSRLELSRAALERELLPRIAAEGYEARLFAFSDTVVPLSDTDMLQGRGSATHLGDALQQALASHRGRHVTDVVILSDGRSNGGAPAAEAARAAAGAGVPVHTVVLGDTRPERNAFLELVEAPPSALEGDEVAIIVRLVGRGVQELSSTPVVLEELTGYGEGPGRVVAEEQVRLSEAGERVLLIAPPGSPDARTSERRFRLTTPALSDETLVDDNALELSVHVTPEKVRVLYVEGYPRWDYRQLALNILKRSDANIEFQAFLLSATADFIQESSDSLPALQAVPTDRLTILENYDVVILGDVNPYAISSDPARCEEFLNTLYEFVERGGGLLFQAGEYDNPRAYLGTPLEDLLPVQLDSGSLLGFSGDTTREVRPLIEDPLNPHEIVRLHADLDVNRRLWEDAGGLRGFYWYYPVSRAKAASQVLLRHPNDGNNYGRHPLLVTGYFPAGRTLFLGLDATWRWRFRYENRYLERFWRNAIRWLAIGRLKSGDGRYRLETPRTSYDLGDRIALEARVLDADFRPSEDPFQSIQVQTPEGGVEEQRLPAVQGRPGYYRGTLDAERPGLYRTWIEVEDQRIASAEFEVVLPSRENADPSPDPALLREMSVVSGGRHLDLAALDDLAAEFPGDEERREPISTQLDDVWDSWTTLLIALGLLSVEWILRKRVELV